MARVNVDQVALTDARFARLAVLRGWADADHARGKMLLIWNETTHRGPLLPVWLIEHHLGAGAAGDLLESELAALVTLAGEVAGVPAGGTLVRIKGCAGRTDWHEKKVKSASLGGKARAATAQRAAGRFTSQAHQPPAGDDTSAPAPAPAPALIESAPKRREPRKQQVPADWKPDGSLLMSTEELIELERFRNHHRSKGNTFANIDLAWRNWQSRSPDFAPRNRPQPANDQIRHIPTIGKRPT